MKCYEYEGKKIFQDFQITIPVGVVANTLAEAIEFFHAQQAPIAIKAQVLSGKRGKAGGIKFADNLTDLKKNFTKIKEMDIYGEKVHTILLEKKLQIAKEFYLGITIDPGVKAPVLIFSPEGGMDIEEIAQQYPDKILKSKLSETSDQSTYQELLAPFALDAELVKKLAEMMDKLARLFYAVDATTAEINPLVVDEQDEIIAADSKLVIDDSAYFRQKELGLAVKEEDDNPLTLRAKAAGLAYVALDDDGYIGSIAGGAGLALATMDTIRFCGGKPANFLDIGGGVTEEKMTNAVKIVAARSNVRGIIVNVFGGINNCEIMARGIQRAITEDGLEAQIVVKMRGHSQEEGWALLESLNIPVIKFGTTEDAVNALLTNLQGGSE